MKIYHIFLACAVSALVFGGCRKACPACLPEDGGPVEVAIGIGNEVNRTMIVGNSVHWNEKDKIAVWAQNKAGDYVFSKQQFTVYGIDCARALFTATLASAMQEGKYWYQATYPVPVSMNGNTAAFNLTDTQDGTGNGLDILVSDKTEGDALVPLEEMTGSFNLHMKHMLHVLRFYLAPGIDGLNGEKITKIKFSMPKAVCGTVNVDLTNPVASLNATSSNVTLELANPIGLSTATATDNAYAVIAPCACSASDYMYVTAYSKSYIAEFAPFPLMGRTFSAGHTTPISLKNPSIAPFYSIKFTLDVCNLGEMPRKITLSAPSGCVFGEGGSNTYEYSTGKDIPVGTVLTFNYTDKAEYNTLSGKTVTVTYESEHVRTSETITMPNITAVYSASVSMTVPWLLYENFSKVESFSSNDEYKTSKAGSYDAHSFLNGWTGARCGAESGKCIRIACRRETSARYDARVDSAPLNGVLIKDATLSIEFSYGANNKYGGLPIIADGNVGQDCKVGYVTSATGYKSGDKTGTFDGNNTFYVKQYTGSYDSTPNNAEYFISGMPLNYSPIRITWRTIIEDQAGTTNTTAWLYIDNVKVKISK